MTDKSAAAATVAPPKFLNIYDWIFSIFLEANSSLNQVSLHFDYDFPQRFITEPPFPLLDPNRNARVMLYGSSETLTTVCYQMVQVLLQRKQSDWQEVEVEFLLWCAVSSCNAETLRLCLEVTRQLDHCVPSALLTSLLGRSIELVFVEGVGLLLNYGAFPDKSVFMKISQLHSSLFLNRCFVDKTLTEITLLLLKFGADPLIKEDSGQIVLHELARIVLHSADTAALIIKATPPIGLDVLAERQNNQVPAMSPLASAFFSASWSPQSQRTARLARIFSFAVLPLLRCGATCKPDPFEVNDDTPPLQFLPELYSMAGKEASVMWGPHSGASNCFIKLAVESRRSGSLHVDGMRRLELDAIARISRDGSLSFNDYASNIRQLVAAIRAEFPRSLQSLCRLAINRSLPLGYRRVDAVNSLGLPSCLEDFVKFSEFDVCPHALISEVDA